MALDQTQAPKANGLKTALDTIISPKEAFEAIAVSPTWGWAFIIAAVLAVIGSLLMVPAVQHGMMGDFARQAATNPQIAQMTDAQKEKIASFVPFFSLFSVIAIPFFVLIQTVILLIFNAVGGGQAGFGKLWAASMNVAIIFGISSLVAALVAIIRGPEAFATSAAVQQSVSLAALMPSDNVKLNALLGAINPFVIWSVILIAMAMMYTAKTSKPIAWIAGLVSCLVPLLIAVGFAR